MALLSWTLLARTAEVARGIAISRLVIMSTALGLVIYLVFTTVKQYYRLRHIPGPLIAGFSNLWIVTGERGGRMNWDIVEVNNKYGPIARIGPNQVVTNDPDLIKHMTNVRTTYKRAHYYYGLRLDPTKDHVLSTRDDAAHNKLRAKMAAGYSGKEISNLEPLIDRNVLALVRLLKDSYISHNKKFDFGRKAQYFTLDTITDISYSRAFGYLANDRDMFEYIATTERQLANLMVVATYPFLINVLSSRLLKPFLPSDKDPIGFGKIIGVSNPIVATRYGPGREVKRDMLGSFVAHGLTRDEAESEVLLQIIAGSDTTATAIRATLLHVLTNPLVLARARAELAATGFTATSPPADTVVSNNDSVTMFPYIQACIKEGLRIHPPAVALFFKEVPRGGDTWKGVYLPPGTNIAHGTWGAMRNKQVWGEDADEFRPERWLELAGSGGAERLKELESTVSLVFSNGRWQCLGKDIALMELNKVIVELLRRFDLVVVDPMKPWDSTAIGIFAQKDFWMRGYNRE